MVALTLAEEEDCGWEVEGGWDDNEDEGRWDGKL